MSGSWDGDFHKKARAHAIGANNRGSAKHTRKKAAVTHKNQLAAGAFVSTMFLGQFADWMKDQGYEGRAQWDPAFYVYSLVLLVGACCWLAVDANRKVPDVEPSPAGHAA